jgi:hypothetical protein
MIKAIGIVVTLAVLGTACYGLTFINWSASCPKGQQLQVVSYVPIMVGKSFVPMPVYACEES